MNTKILALSILASGLSVGVVHGLPIATTTYGGHTYELYDAPGISWATAQAAALAEGGYLAVLTDSTETSKVYGALINNGFFQQSTSQAVQAWLGATPADGSTSTTNPNNWKWVTGEAWTAFDAGNFAGGEPNGDSIGLAINRYGSFRFNDEGSFVGGYIVEKNSIPDGGLTALFLGIGLVGIGTFRRAVKAS
jgi:hypothetical protein